MERCLDALAPNDPLRPAYKTETGSGARRLRVCNCFVLRFSGTKQNVLFFQEAECHCRHHLEHCCKVGCLFQMVQMATQHRNENGEPHQTNPGTATPPKTVSMKFCGPTHNGTG